MPTPTRLRAAHTPFPACSSHALAFPAPLSHVMYTQEEEGLIVGDDPSNKGDDSNPISVKDIQDASTQAALQPHLHAPCTSVTANPYLRDADGGLRPR